MESTVHLQGQGDPQRLPLMLAPQLLAGKVVVVSGGGGSIGRAMAWLAARLGAHVVICGRQGDKLDGVAGAIRDAGMPCENSAFDIRERAAVDLFLAGVFERHGRLDLLINNAGGQFPQAVIDMSEKGWRAVIDTNLNGTFNMMQSAARRWRELGAGGSIVNIVVSPRGLHQIAHTCAARAGVVALTEAVAVEWAPLRIRANCIAPGVIVSDGWAVYAEDVRKRYPDSNPMRCVGTPWQVATAAMFVGGPAGEFINGQTVHTNGGSNLWGEIWSVAKPEWFTEATASWQA
ncbi:MAG TPA: SDR family oxidoreductase [Steroidobacteraceae bacterium]|jgi:citronellol/citronellal dehydrogenase|nr:SDR family oxidoreductase [Steroidobacteraceae bacterium]